MAGINSVAWARDGGNVTTGDTEGYVKTWDVLSSPRSPWLTKFGPPSTVASVAYSPDGRHLAVGFKNPADPASSQSVRVLDTATGELTLTLGGAGGGSVAYSSDGTHLASVQKGDSYGDSYAVQIWDTAMGNLVRELSTILNGIAFEPNSVTYSRTINIDPFAFGILIWNTATGEVTRRLGLG